jgi:hypothetical protein
MTEKTQIIIVSITGSLSECVVETNKETTLDELTTILSKKCGYKKPDGFSCYHTYKYKNKSKSKKIGNGASMVYIDVWCKTDGRAGQENKYDLPPPIDEIIIFGKIALVARVDKENACDLSNETWNKIYEKLFGGFEDLAATAREDDNEIDELAFIHASKKTANGYLKDGFGVEDSISTGSSDADAPVSKKTKKNKTAPNSDTTTESDFVTETETETDSISDSELRSESSEECGAVKRGKGANRKSISNETKKTTNKKAPTKRKPAKNDDSINASTATTATAAAAAGAAGGLRDKSDSELDEDEYSP